VRGWLAVLDCQGVVEKENSLFGPCLKEAVFDGFVAEIALEFFVDILEAGRDAHPWPDAEGEAVGLTLAVIWVLPKNDDANVFWFYQIQRPEYLVRWRIDAFLGSSRLLEEGLEAFHRRIG
jgi:hypothetical protein